MKILIVDEMHPTMVPLLEEIGVEVSNCPSYGKKEALAIINQFDGLIIRSKFFIDDDFLQSATRLKFIGRAGAGLDLIDLDSCKNRGIKVFAANEANKVAVAEQLMGMLLGLFNNIYRSAVEVKNNIWLREENRGIELYGRTVGVIGYGNNGSETAKRLAAFGCKVLAYDKYKKDFGTDSIMECSLEEIFEETEIVTLHFPLTEESKSWVNADFFKKFKKPIFFCNVARGEIVNHTDLVESIISGKVIGACLDVLENEKLNTLNAQQQENFDFLKSHPRVLITPHVAGWTFESYEKINIVLRDKIKSYLDQN